MKSNHVLYRKCWALAPKFVATLLLLNLEVTPSLAEGLSSTPAWIASGDGENAYLATSVASAGDVNGDGYDDVIVGEPGRENGFSGLGRVLLYLGGPSGLPTTPNWIWIDQVFAEPGYSVGSAGDINGAGFDDVIVGAPGYHIGNVDYGLFYIFLGSPLGLGAQPSTTHISEQGEAGFAIAVSSAGDVNGDGYDDVIVGSDLYRSDAAGAGRAFVYLGSPTGLSNEPVWSFGNDNIYAGLGYSVASAGDVNGDGYDDILVGHPDYTNTVLHQGRALLFLGSPAGPVTSPSWVTIGTLMEGYTGISLGKAGDVNGDGYDDVIIGEIRDDLSGPHVYLGSKQGLATEAAWIGGGEVRGQYGWAVAGAGDVQGDG